MNGLGDDADGDIALNNDLTDLIDQHKTVGLGQALGFGGERGMFRDAGQSRRGGQWQVNRAFVRRGALANEGSRS